MPPPIPDLSKKMLHWLYLTAAILLEVAGTISMKLSDGFTRMIPSITLFVCYAASFTALTFSLKKIDLSIAYAVWAGAGTALVVLVGILYFRESITIMKSVSICLIILGVVGLHLDQPVPATGN